MTRHLSKYSTALIFFWLALFSFSIPAMAEGTQNTIFLPLKINALANTGELTTEADRALSTITAEKNMGMLQRSAIAVKLGYEKNWPPSLQSVKPLLPADYQGYLATGSITMLGTVLSIDITLRNLENRSDSHTFFREAGSIAELPDALALIGNEIWSYANRQQLIFAIELKGNRRIDSGAIRQKISTRSGDRFNPEKIRQDLKEIFRMGYFDDIQVETDETPEGRRVTFTVVEKNVIGKVIIKGNDKLGEEDIREVIKIRTNSIINETEIARTVANIRNLYKEKGYYNCEIEVERKKSVRDREDITFSINEGKKVFVKEILFTGNASFKDSKLRKVISSSEKGWFSFITDSGLLKKETLEHDASRLTAYYHNNGFVDAKIGEPEMEQRDGWLYLSFNIEEGERFRCGDIELTGELIEDSEKLMKFVTVDKEEFFNRKVLREDILRISDFYAEKGFAFADVIPRTSKDMINRKIDLVLQIQKGPLVHVNRISIKGNSRTRDKVIRREIMVKEGGIFNASALKESHERLTQLDYFENVNISPESNLTEDLLDIEVEVKEKPTGKFSIGAGYSTVEKMSFMGEISENNLLGRGQRLAAQANLSSISTRFNIDFTEPHIFDTKLLFGINVYNWKREYDDYDKDSRGGAVRLGYPLWKRWRLNGSYGYDDTNLEIDEGTIPAAEIRDSIDFHVTSAVKIGLSRDTKNRRFGATKGSEHSLSVKYAGAFLGGDNSFTKVEANTSWYFPVSKNTTIHPRLSAGYVAGNSEGHLPVYEKFYLGGLSTIRSFDNGQISPIDPVSGDRIGGDKMWYANLEYIFPLMKENGLLGVIFYDIGNVYSLDESWDFTEIKHAAGAGFRWMSPIGPLRLEWGYNLDPEPDEDKRNWDFSIGGMF
ncbi:MAG: outer membrane protein assembly factor BamA [Proteobacteria bacterium]|nr:outer membrane protein assembly factor BamA [Pseudomonadota bacterium]MBU1738635.1 outer membrane protein assembly factor BamA [Pseudomonadota bacterium]